MEPALTSTKVKERPMCGERKDLLITPPNMRGHRLSTVTGVSWLELLEKPH